MIQFALVLIILLFTSSPDQVSAQISAGGTPASFHYAQSSEIPEIELQSPDLASIRNEDAGNEKMGIAKRVGISVNAGIDLVKEGKYELLPGGIKSWCLVVSCRDANALGLYFDEFKLPEGYRLFIYDDAYRKILGAYTSFNCRPDGLFASELLPGDRIILELNADAGTSSTPTCRVSEVSYVYDEVPDFLKNRGTADDCEVNINCPEGTNWQFQKHGVVRIYVKQGGSYYWCSGSLLNNTLQNNEPFLLTADHCAPSGTPDDFAQWLFYFNFEAPECENPAATPVPSTMTGGIKLAGANTSGSDFLLLRLMEDIPETYQPYFNGWSNEDVASPNGVTIHHPAGDIKKISTYTQQIQSSQWFSVPGTHWLVLWSETETNWGVTEGGSSGAPLYDNFGRVIGALTGGQAACADTNNGGGVGPDLPDYFGKFSYSWDQNGIDSSQQLKCWLDPLNSGVTSIGGKNADLTAAFQASQTIILAGGTVEYINLSSGLPVSWEWTFEGGEPGSYSGRDPGLITYPECGAFDVRLIVSNGEESDTLYLTDYIHVVGKVYPNPTTGIVNIYLDQELPALVKADVFNTMGQKLYSKEFPDQTYPLISMDLSLLSAGAYTIRLEIKNHYVFARVLLLSK